MPAQPTSVGDGQFEIVEKVSGGSFGEIFLGREVSTGQQVCVKLEPSNACSPQLAHEAEVMSLLQGGSGIPKLYWHGEHKETLESVGEQQWTVMVIDLLGPNLEDLLGYCQRKLQPETIFTFVFQILARLEFCHSRGVVLRDVKPANFLIGLHDAKTVYAIDFGLASINQTFAKNVDMVGTNRFASVHAHEGVAQTTRDDLESLGYIIMYLMRGVLPWEKALESKGDHCSFGDEGLREATKTQMQNLVLFKRDTPLAQLCDGFPAQLLQYMTYVRQLPWDSTPDYAMLQGLLRDMFPGAQAGSTASSFKSVWARNRGYLPVYYIHHVEKFTKAAAEEALQNAPLPDHFPEVVKKAKRREVSAQAAAKMASRILAGEVQRAEFESMFSCAPATEEGAGQ